MAERPDRLGLLSIATLPYSQENDVLQEMRSTAREWAKDIMPSYVKEARLNFHQHMASRESDVKIPLIFPRQFMLDAAKQNLLGMVIPEEYGGSNLSPLEQVVVMEELSAVDAGLALKILVQNSLTAYPIEKFGTEVQKEKYLRDMAEGKTIACFGLSEPGAGSDAMNIQCKAEHIEGVGWKINGTKTWSTSANGADIMVLAARTGKPESGRDGISTFIVPLDRSKEGLNISTIPKHGQHGSQYCEVTYTNYIIPDDALLGIKNQGENVLKETLNLSRFWIAVQGTGVAMHGYEEAVKYVKERYMQGENDYLVNLPMMIRNLDHMKREIDIARLLVKKAAWAKEKKDKYAFLWSSLAKLIAGEVSFLDTHEAELYSGSMGYTMEREIGYIATDAEVIRIYEGPREVQIRILKKYFDNEQLRLAWPIADHPIRPIESLPTAEEVMAEIESWVIERRTA